jgi:mannosyltransferase PIG-V
MSTLNRLRYPGRAALPASRPIASPATVRWTAIRTRYGWLGAPVGIAVAARVFSTLLLAAVAIHRHVALIGPASIMSRWDAAWYLEIATKGYHAAPIQASALGGHHDYAFFPAWPIVIRLASLGGLLEAPYVGAILAPLLAVAAAAVIAVVLDRAFGRSAAIGGVALLSFSPAAYVFSMAYSEPLFLLAAGLAFLTTKPARRGLAAFVAMFARIAGAAIVAAEGVRFLASRGRDRGALVVALGGIAAFATWWLVVAAISGVPTGFLEGSPAWAPITGIGQVVEVLHGHDTPRLGALLFVGVVLIGALVALRHDLTLGVYALAALALGLLPGGYVGSMPRYALAAFPAYAGLASLLGRRGTIVLTLVFVVLQIAFVDLSLARVHKPIAP